MCSTNFPVCRTRARQPLKQSFQKSCATPFCVKSNSRRFRGSTILVSTSTNSLFAPTNRDVVNCVYDEFKRDFFPGEEVFCIFDEQSESLEGVIREKAKFPMIRGPNGEIQRAAFSRYFVRLHNVPGDEALLDDKHIRRDRKVFTKQNLRAFLKHSLQREAWVGAPWLVKEHLAIQYRLPMEIPAHLLQDAKLLANKVSDNTLIVQDLRLLIFCSSKCFKQSNLASGPRTSRKMSSRDYKPKKWSACVCSNRLV